MKSGVRYWLMIAVLVGATTSMAYLSHGESTPPAKPLTEFPAQVAGYTKAADWPLDEKTIDLLGVTDYLNRGYISKSQGLITLYIGYFRRSEERRVGKECRSRW